MKDFVSNTFSENVTKYQSILEEVYKASAVTSILETSGVLFDGTKTVKFPNLTIDGAADYDRTNGYAPGAATIKYETYELKYDRGRKFRVDAVDNAEQAFDAYRLLAQEYVRTKEVPEIDAIRIARIAENAGTIVSGDITDPVVEFAKAKKVLFNEEVQESDMFMFVSADFLELLTTALANTGRVNLNTNTGDLKISYTKIDGIDMIPVPKSRFNTAITLQDGVTTGQEGGGYVTSGKNINFILASKSALKAITKRYASKIITPEVNQTADSYDIFYRTFHDLIVQSNKKKSIYLHHEA